MDKERFEKILETKGLNISQVEKDLGFSNGALRKNTSIRSDRLLALADYLGVTTDYLLGKDVDLFVLTESEKNLIDFCRENNEKSMDRILKYAKLLCEMNEEKN